LRGGGESEFRVHPVHKLKLDLMTEGVDVTPGAREALDRLYPDRPITLAEYASTSGICLEMPGGVWVNAPIKEFNPNFVFAPTSRLEHAGDERFIVRSGATETPVRPIPVPDFHSELAASGEPFSQLAATHTDRVRISPIEGCAYRCTFCDLPTDFPKIRTKKIADLLEVVHRALHDQTLPARHVLISGGTPRPKDIDYLNEVYEAVTRGFPQLEVDIMMAPTAGALDLKWLHEIGVHALSINLELFSPEALRRYAPQKHALGRAAFERAIGDAADLFGPGRVRSLLMVGLEPMEDTLDGVRFLAELGCQPVLSPFRPAPGTPEERSPPPTAAYLADVYLRAREIVEDYNVKLGPECLACQHNTLTFPD
jgi:hypothetical protein